MSLTSTSNRVVATGDNVTVLFNYTRLLYDATHLQVYLAAVLQTSGYTVNGVPGTSTSVTFTTPPGTGVQVLLLRVVPLTQLSVYAVAGAFPAATTEKNFDLAVMGVQQVDETLDRALVIPATDNNSTTLPDATSRAGKFLYFDSTGTPTATASITAGTLFFAPVSQLFSGTGAQTAFTLSVAPGSADAIIVSLSGVTQKPGTDFTVSGVTLTFTTAPSAATSNILVQNFGVGASVPTVAAGAIVGNLDANTVVATGSTTVRSLATRAADWINVLDYGVTNAGVDSTAAMQTLATGLTSGKVLLFPAGTYKFTDTSTFSKDHTVLLGCGSNQTIINFQPTTTGKPCFLFSKGGATPAIMVGSSMYGFGFTSSANTQHSKKAVQIEVLEEGNFVDIRVSQWTGSDVAANPCLGIHSYGWQILLFKQLFLACELPIRCSINPSSFLDLDHCRFTDCYLVPAATKPCILFDDGLFVSNVHFDGVQAWVGGTQGFLWTDTSGAGTGKSYQLTFDGVRRENGTDATAYCFDITSTSNGLQTLRISDANLNSTQRGLRITSATNNLAVLLNGVQFSASTNEAINFVAASGQTMSTRGCAFTAAQTVTLTGLKEVYSTGLMMNTAPLPPTADYIFDSGVLRSHMKISNVYHLAYSGTLADDATLNLQVGSAVGHNVANIFASMHGATKDEGMVCVGSGATNVFKIAGTANTAVADTDTFLCVYRSGGTIFLKNRLGESVTYVVGIDATP